MTNEKDRKRIHATVTKAQTSYQPESRPVSRVQAPIQKLWLWSKTRQVEVRYAGNLSQAPDAAERQCTSGRHVLHWTATEHYVCNDCGALFAPLQPDANLGPRAAPADPLRETARGIDASAGIKIEGPRCGVCSEPPGAEYYTGVPTKIGPLDMCVKCWRKWKEGAL
jgi:hypothetical protein